MLIKIVMVVWVCAAIAFWLYVVLVVT